MPKRSQTKVLLDNYDAVCNDIVTKFSNKQGLEFDGWVGDEIGGIAGFATQYFFNISDIILDLKTKQPKGLIIEWQSEVVDFNMLKDKPKYINYKSYTMGLRCSDIKDY